MVVDSAGSVGMGVFVVLGHYLNYFSPYLWLCQLGFQSQAEHVIRVKTATLDRTNAVSGHVDAQAHRGRLDLPGSIIAWFCVQDEFADRIRCVASSFEGANLLADWVVSATGANRVKRVWYRCRELWELCVHDLCRSGELDNARWAGTD